MHRILRALLISAVATGAAAVVMNTVMRRPTLVETKEDSDTSYVDADRLSEEEQDALLNELASQL